MAVDAWRPGRAVSDALLFRPPLPPQTLRLPLVLPIPPTSNHMYHPILRHSRAGGTHYSLALTPVAQAWKDEATLAARTWARTQHWVLADKEWIIIWFRLFWPDYRRRDVPNLKALWDALEHVIYPNDCWALPRPLIPQRDPENPRIVLFFYHASELPEDCSEVSPRA